MSKCILECGRDLRARSTLKTCDRCRASMHYWDKRPPTHILDYFNRLGLYQRRMATFAVVKDDEVEMVDHSALQASGLMRFPAKRKARAQRISRKARSIAAQAKIRSIVSTSASTFAEVDRGVDGA